MKNIPSEGYTPPKQKITYEILGNNRKDPSKDSSRDRQLAIVGGFVFLILGFMAKEMISDLKKSLGITGHHFFFYFVIITCFVLNFFWSKRVLFYRQMKKIFKNFKYDYIIFSKEGIKFSPFIVIDDPNQKEKDFLKRTYSFILWSQLDFMRVSSNYNKHQTVYYYRFVLKGYKEILVKRSAFFGQEKDFLKIISQYSKVLMEDKLRDSDEFTTFTIYSIMITVAIFISVLVLLE